MNETTLYLAQIMGVVFLVLGLSFVLKKKAYMKWFKNFKFSEPLLFVTGVIELSAGLAIMHSHCIWGSFAEILISIIGVLMVCEGTATLLLDKKTIKHAVKDVVSSDMIVALQMILIALGAYFMYVGYFM